MIAAACRPAAMLAAQSARRQAPGRPAMAAAASRAAAAAAARRALVRCSAVPIQGAAREQAVAQRLHAVSPHAMLVRMKLLSASWLAGRHPCRLRSPRASAKRAGTWAERKFPPADGLLPARYRLCRWRPHKSC